MPDILLQFGETRDVEDELSLDAATIERAAQGVADEDLLIPHMVPGVGGQSLGNKRDLAKHVLGQLPATKYAIRYQTRGSCPNVDAITIDKVGGRFADGAATSAQFSALGFGVTLSLRVDVAPALGINQYGTVACPPPGKGTRRQRRFTVSWIASVAINPGVTSEHTIKTVDHLVQTPCCPLLAGAGGGVAPVGGAGAVPGGGVGVVPGGEPRDCIDCVGNARYELRKIDGESRHFICVEVRNKCGDDVTVYSEAYKLEPGEPGGNLVPTGRIHKGGPDTAAARRTAGPIEATGITRICVELDRAPEPGETYEILVGPVTTGEGEARRLSRGSIGNCLRQLTIPR